MLRINDDPELLQSVSKGAIKLAVADMTAFNTYVDSDLRFKTIILCNSSVMHLRSDDEIMQLLESVKKSLHPDGVFFLEYSSTFWKTWGWDEKPIEDNQFRMFRRNICDLGTNTAIRLYRFEDREGEKLPVTFYAIFHLFDESEFRKSMKRIGLRILHHQQGIS